MLFSFTRWMRKSFNKTTKTSPRSAARRPLTLDRPRLETLESRLAPAALAIENSSCTIAWSFALEGYQYSSSAGEYLAKSYVYSKIIEDGSIYVNGGSGGLNYYVFSAGWGDSSSLSSAWLNNYYNP